MTTSKVPKESVEQVKLVNVLRWVYPDIVFHSIPNGAQVHPATAARLKAEGMTAGVSDLFFPEPRGDFHGLYLEMKRQRGGTVSKEQTEWMAKMAIRGYAVAVGRGYKKALETIDEYLKGDHDGLKETQKKYRDFWREISHPRKVGG